MIRMNVATVRASAQVSGIQECFSAGTRNNVWDAGMATGRAMKANMARTAPAHPNQIRKGQWIQRHQLSDPTAYAGPNGNVAALRMWVNIGCLADHAIYVHEGTIGKRIKGHRGYMFIPPGPWGPRAIFADHSVYEGGGVFRKTGGTVAGQRANPWMTRSMAMTLAMRGFTR